MNKRRRQKLNNVIDLLNKASYMIDECKDSEEDSISNLEGTSLEYTCKYESMECSYEHMGSAIDKIESAKDELYSAMYP